MQDSHRMHWDKSMENGCLIWPVIAFTGQALAHLEQPLQSAGSIQMRLSFWQLPAGQRFSRM